MKKEAVIAEAADAVRELLESNPGIFEILNDESETKFTFNFTVRLTPEGATVKTKLSYSRKFVDERDADITEQKTYEQKNGRQHESTGHSVSDAFAETGYSPRKHGGDSENPMF